MGDFNIRSESVDVEQIMKQIRARVREKRGIDYTEDQIRELASVRLEKFLDPKNLRSDLLEQFRRSRPALPSAPAPVEAPYSFDDETLFETHRGALRFLRKLLRPILKLFFNPNPLINVLHTQAQFNVDLLKREQRRKIEFDRSRAEWNALYYEVLHNLVLETTRSGIEIKNLKMRVESLVSRLDFSERRVRALEGVVQYRPDALRPRDGRDGRGSRQEPASATGAAPTEGASGEAASAQSAATAEGARRRRRRRRGRRGAGGQAIGAPSGEPADVADAPMDTMESGVEAEGGEEYEAAPAPHDERPQLAEDESLAQAPAAVEPAETDDGQAESRDDEPQ